MLAARFVVVRVRVVLLAARLAGFAAALRLGAARFLPVRRLIALLSELNISIPFCLSSGICLTFASRHVCTEMSVNLWTYLLGLT